MADLNMPAGRDLGTEYSKTLSAQIGILPNLLGAEAQYQPIETSQKLGNINDLLMGTQASDYDTSVYNPAVYSTDGHLSYGRIPKGITGQIQYPNLRDPQTIGSNPGPADKLASSLQGATTAFDPLASALFGKNSPQSKLVKAGGYTVTKHHLNAQRGLLDLYQNELTPTLERVASSTRASDINDVMNLGPQAMAAFRKSNPQLAALLDQITSQAGTDMGQGAQMDPQLMRMFSQGIRGGQAARGLGYGPSDAYLEGLGVTQFGQQLKQQRFQNAGTAAQLDQSIMGDPFSRVLGQPGAGMGATSGAVGQALGLSGQAGPLGLLNPESSYAQDLNNTNFNTLVNGAIAKYNGQNALIGSGIQAAGSLAGAGMGAI